jgi:hypothetical protein
MSEMDLCVVELEKRCEMGSCEMGPTGVRKVSKAVVIELHKTVTFEWWLCSGCELARHVNVGK